MDNCLIQALRDGCVSHVLSGSLVSLPSVPVAATLLASSQSFSACPESWYRTYVSWLSGSLSRRCLLEVVSSEDAGRYLVSRETGNLDNCLSDRLQTRVCSLPLPAVTSPSLLPCQPPSSLLPPEDVLDECSIGVEKPCFSAGSRHLEFRVENCAEGGSSKNPRQSQPVGLTDRGSSENARHFQPVLSECPSEVRRSTADHEVLQKNSLATLHTDSSLSFTKRRFFRVHANGRPDPRELRTGSSFHCGRPLHWERFKAKRSFKESLVQQLQSRSSRKAKGDRMIRFPTQFR